ncbi:MAG TPA: histidine kinase dimerization/phosphoacceptor domain -containing protein [Sphingomonas sp.]|uniref:histidine kinase dimerization/phosphoacceptor domain -containing protein n=1 Tax=Sphingomonas sp. TaxID=28214 RepID=UPI002ED8D756
MRPIDHDLKAGASMSALGADVTSCDWEPIHIPGAIQPHGLLLVVDPGTMTVVAGAGDIEGRLAVDWLDRPLADLLGPDASRASTAAASVAVLAQHRGLRETFDVSCHRSGDHILVELEPVTSQPVDAVALLTDLDTVSAAFERATDLRALAERAAIAFRQLTGFERVMVYRFLDDDTGVVIAEDRDPALDSFLNHHFPASDIPRQARALYVRNRVRVIPDIRYRPAPLRPASDAMPATDMSDVAIRSVSPIHLQYLRNMGVLASASVSIVRDGVLWGLIACHDRQPRRLDVRARLFCKALVGGLARQITAREDAETYRERIRLRASEDMIAARLGGNSMLAPFLGNTADELRRLLAADGFAAVQGGDVILSGHTPDRDTVRMLAGWLRERTGTQPFSTHHLSALLPNAAPHIDTASGLMAVTLPGDDPVTLIWLRAEMVEVVNWAGNPHKAVGADPAAHLTPRASFAAWREAVHGRARRWTLAEIEAAARIRRMLVDARQNRRLRELNAELTATVSEKEALLLQKDYLLKEVNHRVQNSLQLVSAFLRLQGRSVDDPTLSGHLDEAQRRLSAVALVHRRLYSDDRVETVDLARYIEDLCGEIRESMGNEGAHAIHLDLAPVLVPTDKAVTIGLILTELVINASKYAYGGEAGPITIALDERQNRFRLVVADRGIGKARTREGFGTRMLAAMVDQLSGTMEELDNRPGLRIIIAAPIADS